MNPVGFQISHRKQMKSFLYKDIPHHVFTMGNVKLTSRNLSCLRRPGKQGFTNLLIITICTTLRLKPVFVCFGSSNVQLFSNSDYTHPHTQDLTHSLTHSHTLTYGHVLTQFKKTHYHRYTDIHTHTENSVSSAMEPPDRQQIMRGERL